MTVRPRPQANARPFSPLMPGGPQLTASGRKSVRRRILAACAVTVLALTGCGGNGDDEGGGETPQASGSQSAAADSLDAVKVTGKPDAKPSVELPTPLVIAKPAHKTLVTGSGEKLAAGKQVSANITMVSGTTGKVANSTYDQGKPATFPMDKENGISEDLYSALEGQPVGSRIAVAMQGSAQQGEAAQTLVYIIDIVKQENAPKTYTKAEGKAVAPAKGMPKVTRDAKGKPSIAKPQGKAPTSLVSDYVIEGKGAEVKKGQKVSVQYSGWLWTDNTKTFDSSWDKGQPFSFTTGGGEVIAGWDEGVVGKKVGSQILLVVPPDKGYGVQESGSIPANSTLVFVVDILSAAG